MAALLLASLAAASAPPDLEPPPGWSRAVENQPAGVVISLQGPETSSFVIKHAPALPLDNSAGVRGYLHEVLAGIREASGREYRASARLETRRFRNGLQISLLRAALEGEPRLLLGAFSAGGAPYLAVLHSAAPEAMADALFGAITLGGREPRVSGVERSLDGQLELALGGGLSARGLSETERGKGFVLAVQGGGCELLFQRLDSDEAKPGEQAAIVREVAAATARAPKSRVSPALAAGTAAGPAGVYAWVPLEPASAGSLAVGYLPWCFWGYQLLGRGPYADEFLVGALAALKPGPAADLKLLGSTPAVPAPDEEPPRERLMKLGAAALGLLFLSLWSLRPKNANLPP